MIWIEETADIAVITVDMGKDPCGWCSSTIVQILKKREYLGHTVNFKTRKHFKDKKSYYVDEGDWVIFENTHEAIIDQDTFDNVQRIRGNVKRYPDGWGEAAPLTGLMFCADCDGKKAEIDAKKSAIRAEDIASGVFTHVRDLPRQEPRKSSSPGPTYTPVSAP